MIARWVQWGRELRGDQELRYQLLQLVINLLIVGLVLFGLAYSAVLVSFGTAQTLLSYYGHGDTLLALFARVAPPAAAPSGATLTDMMEVVSAPPVTFPWYTHALGALVGCLVLLFVFNRANSESREIPASVFDEADAAPDVEEEEEVEGEKPAVVYTDNIVHLKAYKRKRKKTGKGKG